MMSLRCGWPACTWAMRASFITVSMASEPDEVKKTRALGVGADLAQLLRQRLRRLVGERVERRVGAERAHLRGDGVGHLRATVADRVVPQAGHAIDELAAVLVPHQGAFAAFDADEALAGGLGVWVEERCRHVTTVPNPLASSRVAHTLRRRGGAGAPNRDNNDAAAAASVPHAADRRGGSASPRRLPGCRCCVRCSSCWR